MLMRKLRLFTSQSQSVGKTTGLPATSTEKFSIQGKVIGMVKCIQRKHRIHTDTKRTLRLEYLPSICQYQQKLFHNVGRKMDPKVNTQSHSITQPNYGSAQLQTAARSGQLLWRSTRKDEPEF